MALFEEHSVIYVLLRYLVLLHRYLHLIEIALRELQAVLQKDILRIHVLILEHFQLLLEADDFVDLTALRVHRNLAQRRHFIDLAAFFVAGPGCLSWARRRLALLLH